MGWTKTVSDFSIEKLHSGTYRLHLRSLLSEYHVLIIRGQEKIGLDEQTSLARAFGSVHPSLPVDTPHPDSSKIQVIQRNMVEGKVERVSSSHYWHTDRSFLVHPPLATLLHCVVEPDFGGDTLFANMNAAFNDCPEDDKAHYRRLKIWHSYAHYRENLQRAFFARAQAEEASALYPNVLHPLVCHDLLSGSEAFYLSELCGVGAANTTESLGGGSLIKTLHAVTTRQENIYRHKWATGDLLIWNNASVMHRGTSFSGRRVMHRAVSGYLSFPTRSQAS